MSENQANQCLSMLTDLFPQADLQVAEMNVFKNAIMPFEEADVRGAIERHRLACKFNRPSFDDILADARRADKSRHSTDAGLSTYATEQRMIAERAAASDVKAEWSAIESFIADQSDEDLADYKQMVLNKSDPDMAKFLSTRDPRKSKLLMGRIAEIAKVA